MNYPGLYLKPLPTVLGKVRSRSPRLFLMSLLHVTACLFVVVIFCSRLFCRVQLIPTRAGHLIPTCPWRRTRRRLGVKPSARSCSSSREPRCTYSNRILICFIAFISVYSPFFYLFIFADQTCGICSENQCQLLRGSG